MKKIKIIKASISYYWYAEHIGKELYVEDELTCYYITELGKVEKQDAKVCDDWHTAPTSGG